MRLGLYLDDATGLCHRSAGLYHRRDWTDILDDATRLCHMPQDFVNEAGSELRDFVIETAPDLLH